MNILGNEFAPSEVPEETRLSMSPRVAGEEVESCEVVVVSKHEVGFVVVDVSDDKKRRVFGARVSVASRFAPGKCVEGVTDGDGKVVFDITELSEGADGTGKQLDAYAFNGRLSLEKAGYRLFQTGLVRVEGGSAVVVPTRPVIPDEPYAVLMTFDDWDMQYSASTFACTPKNDVRHTIAMKCMMPGGAKPEVSFHSEGNVALCAAAPVATSLEEVSVAFEGYFLLSGHADCLKEGARSYFEVEVAGKKYRIDTRLEVVSGVLDAWREGEDFHLAPSDSVLKCDLDFALPKSFPGIGGSKVSVWIPDLPFFFQADPFGHVLFGATLPGLGFVNDGGGLGGVNWGRQTRESAAAQWSKKKESWSKSRDQYLQSKEATYDKLSGQGMIPFTEKLKTTIVFQAYAQAKWDWTTRKWSGDLMGLLQLKFTANYTYQTVLGPVPVFCGLDFAALAKASIGAGLSMVALDPQSITWDFKASGFILNLTFSLGVSVGVGIVGVASFGFRGSGYVSFFVGFTPSKAKGDPIPHCIVGAGASFDLVVQILLVKWSTRICGKDWPSLYNNWPSEKSSVSSTDLSSVDSPFMFELPNTDARGFSMAASSLDAPLASAEAWRLFVEGGVLVTNDELKKTAEFRASSIPSLDAGSQGKSAHEFASGTVLSEYRYDYVGSCIESVCACGGIEGLGASGGIKPTIDVKIVENIWSDPRTRVVSFQGQLYLFRILTVTYPGGAVRSRLAAQRYEDKAQTWGVAHVIEFDSGQAEVARVDLFDYEFDVTAFDQEWMGFPPSLCVFMVCGKRVHGDNTTVAEVLTEPFVAYLTVNENLDVTSRFVSRTLTGVGYEAGKCHAYSCPRIIRLRPNPLMFTEPVPVFEVVYIHRCAASRDAVLTSDATVVLEMGNMLGFCAGPVGVHASVAIDSKTYDIVLTSKEPPADQVCACSVACYTDTGIDVYTAWGPQDKVVVRHNVAKAPAGVSLVTWPDHDGFVFAREGHLYLADFAIEQVGGSWNPVEIGPENFDTQAFAMSSDGRLLYASQSKSGKTGQTYREDGSRIDETSETNHIMAAKYLDGKFTKMFVFAEISQPFDHLVQMPFGSASSAFLGTSITDMSQSKADLYFTCVPQVACATALSLACDDDFVGAGTEASFSMAVRNDGNMALSAFTATLYDEQGTKVASVLVSALSEHLCGSVWNPELLEPEFNRDFWLKQGKEGSRTAAQAGVLLPGQTSMYRMRFALPADWTGKRSVRGGISAPVVSRKRGFVEESVDELVVHDSFVFSEAPITHVEAKLAEILDQSDQFDC
ncbi:MAG: hypothetical protein RR178_03610 [Gordonibacter sp.]